MVHNIYNFMLNNGLGEEISGYVTNAIVIAFIIVISILIHLISKNVVLKLIKALIVKSKSKIDDIFFEHKVIEKLIIIIPSFAMYALSPMLLYGQVWLKKFAFCMIVYGIVRTVDKFLNAADDIYRRTEASKTKPIKGFLQIIKIFAYAIGAIIVISVMMDRSPVLLLGGIGAASAVLMLIFQNTILGFVASIQLTENDMLRIGDWVEMPSHNADGDVVDISLHTVKVVNWDKTVTTIPTYDMISKSFKNWRNMQEIGGRRIKRSIYIDMTSIHFCTEAMLERYQKIQYIKPYLESKMNDIREYNEKNKVDLSSLVNGRRLTNLGTFRAYLDAYLKNHPSVHRGLTMLVRYLEPTANGLPIELYIFTNTTKWADYEAIQADIFDHILAIVPEFDLRIYQSPTGHDFSKASF